MHVVSLASSSTNQHVLVTQLPCYTDGRTEVQSQATMPVLLCELEATTPWEPTPKEAVLHSPGWAFPLNRGSIFTSAKGHCAGLQMIVYLEVPQYKEVRIGVM